MRLLLLKPEQIIGYYSIGHSFLKRTVMVVLSILFVSIFHHQSSAQKNLFPHAATDLLPLIETQLEKETSDTSFHFITLLTKGRCATDFQCLIDSYGFIRREMEKRFNLPAAIFVSEEMLSISIAANEKEHIAAAYQNLSRFHDALGNRHLAMSNMLQAENLFKELGNAQMVSYIKMNNLERSLEYNDIEEILPQMKKLLKDAEERGDTSSVHRMHIRLLHISFSNKLYDEAEVHVSALERIKDEFPNSNHWYAYAILAALGRGDLLSHYGMYADAEPHFLEALRLCREEPSRWLEIDVLHSLADMEWKRGNRDKAKAYLNSANQKATELDLDDLLNSNYRIASEFAEAENRYEDALVALRKQLYHEKQFKNKSKGFDHRSYMLEKEKEQLAFEKKNSELELKLQKVQLRNSLIIIGVAILTAVIFVFAFFYIRKRNVELSEQNALIQKQAERLSNLDTAKSRFFANVSHELRTPLSLILGPISSLRQDGGLNKRQEKLLNMASQNGQQLEHLVSEILDLGKLELGKMELALKPTPIRPFFRRYFMQFDSLAERKKIKYSYSFNFNDDRLTAMLDQTKSRQILYNLLSNAFKFSPEGGMVNATIHHYNDTLTLEVRDSGPGIHPEDLPHVFDRFFQTNQVNQPAVGGSGVGLALCHEYALLFNGKIEAESILGKGATFRLNFPIELVEPEVEEVTGDLGSPQHDEKEAPVSAQPKQAIPVKKKKKAPGKPQNGKPNILVVEDNPELQDYLSLVLENEYNVTTAEHGKQAMEALEERPINNPFDLVISDLMMPVMDGFQLLEKLKSNPETYPYPVIMLTARAEARDRMTALRIGVDDYLLKPFEEEELKVRINNLLKNKAVRHESTSKEKSESSQVLEISEADKKWLADFEKYLMKNLSNDIMTVPLLANEFTMSESSLLRQLKRLTGLSPIQYIREMKMDKARVMLEEKTYKSISKVASKVGYADVRTFSRAFKKRFGKLPSQYLSQ